MFAYSKPEQKQAPKSTVQKKESEKAHAPLPNQTGIPDSMKMRFENLSGFSFDDVRVHYNSGKPAQLQALAYAQGNQVHIAPGQEKHLGHELGHVVQQKQGRVRMTANIGGTAINDDVSLEREVDTEGYTSLDNSKSRGSNQKVTQLYVERKGYHISEDNAMAVKNITNNKELYATPERVDEAERILRDKTNSISLHAGAKTNFGDTEIGDSLNKVEATVSEKDNEFNKINDEYKARAAGPELPSECEKGAVAILGSYIQNEKHERNTYNNIIKNHSHDRIANLIARSQSYEEVKQNWYDEWARLDGFIKQCSLAFNEFNNSRKVPEGILETFIHYASANYNEILPLFNKDIKKRDKIYEPKDDFILARQAMYDIICILDNKVNELEHLIMRSVNNVEYNSKYNRLLEMRDLQQKIINLYSKEQYPKNIIEDALRETNKMEKLKKYFKDDKGIYKSDLFFFKEARMNSFLEEVVKSLTEKIITLEEERRAKFGNVDGFNKSVDPKVGQAYGIIGGGYKGTDYGRWNWHWASVIMKSTTDNVTMETHASKKKGTETHNDLWDFKMYGRPTYSNTFHEIQGKLSSDGFGRTPVTILGKPFIGKVVVSDFTTYGIQDFHGTEVNNCIESASNLKRLIKEIDESGDKKTGCTARTGSIDSEKVKLPAVFLANKINAPLTLFIENCQDSAKYADASINANSLVSELDNLVNQLYEKRRELKMAD